MSERLFGTLKYIHIRGAIRRRTLKRVHGGTLNALLKRGWLYAYKSQEDEWISLTDEGEAAFKSYFTAGLSLRKHEADLTENTYRLLTMVRLKAARSGVLHMKKVG